MKVHLVHCLMFCKSWILFLLLKWLGIVLCMAENFLVRFILLIIKWNKKFINVKILFYFIIWLIYLVLRLWNFYCWVFFKLLFLIWRFIVFCCFVFFIMLFWYDGIVNIKCGVLVFMVLIINILLKLVCFYWIGCNDCSE